MSCFESSTFKRNRQIANALYMAQACQKLGIKHESSGSYVTRIYDENNQLLMVVDYGRIYFNEENDASVIDKLEKAATDYYEDNKAEIDEQNRKEEEDLMIFYERLRQRHVEKAQPKKVVNRLDVEYARIAAIRSFESKGFFYQPDNSFVADELIADRFYMCAYTVLDELPEDRKTSIQFDVMQDGSIISDSNYIPEDVHQNADDAMEELEKAMGFPRREGIEIKRKRIPEAYKLKSYCSIHSKNKEASAMA